MFQSLLFRQSVGSLAIIFLLFCFQYFLYFIYVIKFTILFVLIAKKHTIQIVYTAPDRQTAAQLPKADAVPNWQNDFLPLGCCWRRASVGNAAYEQYILLLPAKVHKIQRTKPTTWANSSAVQRLFVLLLLDFVVVVGFVFIIFSFINKPEHPFLLLICWRDTE